MGSTTSGYEPKLYKCVDCGVLQPPASLRYNIMPIDIYVWHCLDTKRCERFKAQVLSEQAAKPADQLLKLEHLNGTKYGDS